jgi:hypothetical protein
MATILTSIIVFIRNTFSVITLQAMPETKVSLVVGESVMVIDIKDDLAG